MSCYSRLISDLGTGSICYTSERKKNGMYFNKIAQVLFKEKQVLPSVRHVLLWRAVEF
jgi:hypothetical protein